MDSWLFYNYLDQYEYATSFANEMMTETRTVKQIF